MSQLPENPVNRRAAIRRKPKGVQVHCRRGSVGIGPDIGLVIRSLSQNGARILVTERLEAGEEIEIELESVALLKPVKLLAKVVRAVRVPGCVYCTAVRFEKLLSYAEFSRMT